MHPGPMALVLYSAQILLVVCVAALASGLSRLSVPAVRLAYWRGVGAICIVLPLLPVPRADAPVVSVAWGVGALIGVDSEPAKPLAMTLGTALLWIWASGVVVRLGALVAGAFRLRQLRRRSVPATLGADIDALKTALAPHADVRWSSALNQPVTFGIRRPVILLPRAFGDLSTDARCAVACHELLHVARRDWLWIVVEEHARALFWFHPGVWWLVEQVQLAREQVIDHLVVTRTAAKRAYMSALLTFADQGPHARLSLAFLRRRHLKSRFQLLSKESHMSFARLAWTTTVMASVMICTAVGAARAFPLDLQTLVQQGGAAPQLEIRLAESAPAAGLTEAAVPGSNQRTYLHPDALATAADVSSARAINTGGPTYAVSVTFNAAAAARLMTATSAHIGRPMAIILDRNVIAILTVRGPVSDSAMITGLTADSANALAARLDRVVPAQGAARPAGVTLPVPIRRVRPFYTEAAMAAGIEGNVLMEVVVLTDGSVGDVAVVRSLDATLGLDQQAMSAVKQWAFKPGTKDGKPERVAVSIEMTFTLK